MIISGYKLIGLNVFSETPDINSHFNPFATVICVNYSTVYNDTLVAKGLIFFGWAC